MKQFFGAFLGSLIGLFFATILGVIVLVATIKTTFDETVKNTSETEVLTGGPILKIKLSGDLRDREKEDPFADLKKLSKISSEEGTGLNSILRKLEKAAKDENIKALFLQVEGITAGYATVKELRNALAEFKHSGKFIYAYSENFSQKDYYLASVSSRIFLHPQGGVDFKGLSMSILFYKKMFDKLGLEMQIFRHGKFKSAIEPFMLDKMSEANRLQSETFLNSIWSTMLNGISEDRKIDVSTLQQLANELMVRDAEDAVKHHLVDALAYEDEMMGEMKKKAGLEPGSKKIFTELSKYRGKVESGTEKIAVIYAVGQISSGEGDDDEIGSDRIAKAIRAARLDESVKAIVLRVNSPGGSALASDIIWRETQLAGQNKPFVVSMGDYAASGGYYISCAAHRIFAQPNTITGSIGVFGMLPNIKGTLEDKLGITVDTVNTNAHSAMGSALAPIAGKEHEFIQIGVEKVYEVFTSRVAEGRKMKVSDVDSIGQGRVWSGMDAKKIGLVDEIGGLKEAVAYAAQKAGLKEYRLQELPRMKNPLNDILGKMEDEAETKWMKENLGVSVPYFHQMRKFLRLKGTQAILPFELLIN